MDLPEREGADGEKLTEEEWQGAVVSAVEDAAGDIRQAAEDALSDMPEYEG